MRAALSGLLLLLSFSLPLCSQAPKPKPQTSKKATAPLAKKDAPRTEIPDLEKYGMQLLEIAEADAGAIEGGTRAYVLMQIARGYEKTNKAKSIELLENALVSTRVMEEGDGFRTRARLQKEILNVLVPLAPERVDDLLTQVESSARGNVLKSLLAYYEKNNNLDRAIEVLYRIGQEQEIPYDAVARVMSALPEEKAGESMQLFTTALGSYRNHQHDNSGVSFGGTTSFPELIVAYWKQLPPQLAMEAIDEVLTQSKPKDDEGQHGITVGAANGTASFNSSYEYALFQLLPVIKELDPPRAEQLLRDNQQVKALAAKYPEGNKSILSGGKDASTASKADRRMVASYSGNPDAQRQAELQAAVEESKRAADIVENSIEHPQDALAQVATLTQLPMRGNALEGIAQENLKRNTSVANSALKQLIELAPRLADFQQSRTMNAAALMYLKMGDTESAKSAVEKGFKGVEQIYRQDTNAEDPNKALKVYWPSAQAYAVLLRTAGRISAPWALTLLKEIPDAEIKATAEVSLASEWLKLPGGTVTIMRKTKNANGLWMTWIE